MKWLDPVDPRVRAAVVSGFWGRTPHSLHYQTPPADPDEIDVIADVLDQASDTLGAVTAGVFHPPVQVVEDFVCPPSTARLTPSVGPVRGVASVHAVQDNGSEAVLVEDWVLFGGNVRFVQKDEVQYPWMGWPWLDLATLWVLRWNRPCKPTQRLRLIYNAGSTITAKARAMVLALAHELYLQVAPCDECGACRLPVRTTNVIREGISYNLADPLAQGSLPGTTGLPEVDLWVRQVNPYRVGSPSRVYAGDAPPPVQVSLVSARETFPVVPDGRVVAAAAVAARGVVS